MYSVIATPSAAHAEGGINNCFDYVRTYRHPYVDIFVIARGGGWAAIGTQGIEDIDTRTWNMAA